MDSDPVDYVPPIGASGQHVDLISNDLPRYKRIRCICNLRTYESVAKLEMHCKTDKHKYWLNNQNLLLVTRLLEDKKTQLSVLNEAKRVSELDKDQRITRLQSRLMKADRRVHHLRNKQSAELDAEVETLRIEKQKLEDDCTFYQNEWTKRNREIRSLAESIDRLHKTALNLVCDIESRSRSL